MSEILSGLEILKNSAKNGDTDTLYGLIREDPEILERYKHHSLCDTPAHIAAESGQTQFLLELIGLSPSLATKLSLSGATPMHVALERNDMRTVRALVAVNPELVRTKGRGCITPMHYAARHGLDDMLSEFLMICPGSVDDVTVSCDTIAHLCVKSHQLSTLRVLVGWVKRAKRQDLLEKKNIDGNTVLHLAASINHIEMINFLTKCKLVKVNARNWDGKTAKDIQRVYPSPPLSRARRFVEMVKEKLNSPSTTTLADYLRKDLSFMEIRNNLLEINNLSMIRGLQSSNRRDAAIVVAILIMTVVYSAYFSPPGGFWQEDTPDLYAGKMIMKFSDAFIFLLLNGVCYITSLAMIATLVIGLPLWKMVYASTALLGIAMVASHKTILPFPVKDNPIRELISVVVFIYFPVLIGGVLLAALTAFLIDKCRRQKVDFPATCFTSYNDM